MSQCPDCGHNGFTEGAPCERCVDSESNEVHPDSQETNDLGTITVGKRHRNAEDPDPPTVELEDHEHPNIELAKRIGEVVGSYTLTGVLGEGGMGVVYLAKHNLIGLKVALKMLHVDLVADPESVRRFFLEARLVATLSHPNIVEITDFVEDPGADNYLIMELLEGDTLRKVLYDTSALSVSRAMHICRQIAAALGAVHDAGIVHRDLKPSNVILVSGDNGEEDVVKLVDFGIAKAVGSDKEQPSFQTSRSTLLGTPHFMSPEQARSRPVDHRSDIFSLGVLMYLMLGGRLPFNPESLGDLVVQHHEGSPPPVGSPGLASHTPPIPRALERLVASCLELDPNKRPPDMATIEARIKAIETHRSTDDRVDVTDGKRHIIEKFSTRAKYAARKHWPGVLAATLIAALAITFASRKGGTGQQDTNDPTTETAIEQPVPRPPESESVLPDTVTVQFISTPIGLEVTRPGEIKALGRTPFSLQLPRGDTPQAFELTSPDGVVIRREVVPNDNVIVDIILKTKVVAPTQPAKGSTKRPKQKASDRAKDDSAPLTDGLRDPWGAPR